MSSAGAIGVLFLIALLGWWIVSDKKLDGMMPFYVLNGLALVGLAGTFVWMFFDWLMK